MLTVRCCPECNGEIVHVDDETAFEYACRNCGYVLAKDLTPSNQVPMGETRSPSCGLDAFTGSLGTTMNSKQLYQVRAVDYPNGGGAVRQIRVQTERWKHPIIQRMDIYGSRLLDRYYNRRVGRRSRSHIFAQELSKAIDRVGESLKTRNDGHKAKKMTEASFLWTWHHKMKLQGAQILAKHFWKKGGAAEILEVSRIMSSLPPDHPSYPHKNRHSFKCEQPAHLQSG